MSNVEIGDLVWVPDKTCGWSPSKAIEISGPTLALIKEIHPFRILVSIEGNQEELSVLKKDVYDVGDLYD